MKKFFNREISKASMRLLIALIVSFQTNLYAETDTHWEDYDVLMLHEHTQGNGVAIAIIGDGFAAGDMTKGGVYETRCRELAAEFLKLPVIEDFKDLFDVYCVMAVSPVGDVAPGTDNAFGMLDDIGTAVYNAQVFMDNAGLPYYRSFIFMGNGQVGGYALFEDHCAIYSIVEPDIPYWMIHEFAGHAFAGLADEYAADCSWTVEELNNYQSMGVCLNVSATNDLSEVPWRDFIGRSGYGNVGAYEGAWMCNTGFWRSETTSTMRDNPNFYYNAMSRWLIYKKMHEEAGVEYNFGAFLQYDRKFVDAAGEIEIWNIGKDNPLDVLATLNTASGNMTIESFGAAGGTEEALSFRTSAINHLRLTENADGSVTVATYGSNITDPYIYINNLQSDIPADASSIKMTFEFKSDVTVTDAAIFFFGAGAHVGDMGGFIIPAVPDWTYGELDLTSKILELYPAFGYAGDFMRYDPIANVDAATAIAYSITIRNMKLKITAPPKAMADFSNMQPWADFRDAIREVTVKSGVGSIGESAFACSGITKIDIPETLTTISANAFRKCNSLATIEVHYADPTVITVDEDAFACISDLAAINLIVPAGKEDIYRNTAPWKYMMGNGTPPAIGSDCNECMTANIKVPVESFTLSPNPTKGIVNINNIKGEVVEVYAISGTLLFKTNASAIDLRNYSSGMYFIKMGNKAGKVIKK